MSESRGSVGFQLAAAVFGWLVCLPILIFISGCKHEETPVERAASEQTIKDLDALWSQSASHRDVEATVSFYSPDAVSKLPESGTVASGKAIRSSWAQYFEQVQSVSWHVDRVEVADSGDMAYGSGEWTATFWTPEQSLETRRGKLLEVWKKLPGESWKAVVATYNGDVPSTGRGGGRSQEVTELGRERSDQEL